MLVLEVFRYLKRRADKRPVRLANFVSMENHHGLRDTEPKVAIIIPTRDKYELLHQCIESIKNNTAYANYEILVVNNGSCELPTIEYLALLSSEGHTVLDFPEAFNYSKICNFASENTSAEYLCLLNNDTEVIEPNWLGLLLDHAVQSGIGLVGSKLIYPDGTLQHLGVSLGYTGAAGHPFYTLQDTSLEVGGLANECFQVSAVTFACVVVSSEKYAALRGLDPSFKVGLNDIDYAVRVAVDGDKVILCGRSCLIHHESKSRRTTSSLRGGTRASYEIVRFLGLHGRKLKEDYFFRP